MNYIIQINPACRKIIIFEVQNKQNNKIFSLRSFKSFFCFFICIIDNPDTRRLGSRIPWHAHPTGGMKLYYFFDINKPKIYKLQMFEYFKRNKRDRRKRKMQPITLKFHVLLSIKIKLLFLCLYLIIRKMKVESDEG